MLLATLQRGIDGSEFALALVSGQNGAGGFSWLPSLSLIRFLSRREYSVVRPDRRFRTPTNQLHDAHQHQSKANFGRLFDHLRFTSQQ